MKRIFALFWACAFALSLSACKKTEKRVNVGTIEHSAQKSADIDETDDSDADHSSETDTVPDSDSVPEEPPVHIDDIHEWDEDNALYNINETYELTDRYFTPFEWIDQSAALWYGDENAAPLDEKYDPDKAVEFAKAHWNDGLDVCAPFISRCLEAGGLSIGSDSSTALCFKLLNSRFGFGQFLPMNADGTVTLPEYAAPGDVVQLYCSYEGLMIHSMIFVGNDELGRMKVCCHNPKNSGTYAFRYYKECNSCLTPLKEIFYFHFFGEDEERPEAVLENSNTLLIENTGYVIPDQSYNRQSAVRAVMNDPIDGLGKLGAEQTSAALTAGGLYVETPIQTALFMRLMKSRLGAVYSVPINPDRTVTLPEFVKEGDVCFLCCHDESLIYSSFIIKGADADGKMLGYTRDMINSEYEAFKAESVCPSSICDGEVTEALIFHFAD